MFLGGVFLIFGIKNQSYRFSFAEFHEGLDGVEVFHLLGYATVRDRSVKESLNLSRLILE